MSARIILIVLLLTFSMPRLPMAAPPETPKHPVTDEYHGVEVTDPYRWLEDFEDPRVREWSAAQNRHARSYLKDLPNVDKIRDRVTEILADDSESYGGVAARGDLLFAIKRQPPKQQPFLIVMSGLDDVENARVLVDPSEIDRDGTTKIDWFVPSPDGQLVAVSLSRMGTESGDVHIFDTETGKTVHEVIPRVNGGTAGGDLAWSPDGSGFFYTRYPRGEERPPEDRDFYQQVYYHQLGQPTSEDRYELGAGLPRIAEIQLRSHPTNGEILATVQDGDGGEFAHFLRSTSGEWRQFSEFGDRIVQAEFGPAGTLCLVSRADAPRGKLLKLETSHLDPSRADVLIPEGEETIVSSFWGTPSVLFAGEKLFVIYQTGGPSEIRVFDLTGKPQPAPELAPISSVGGMTRIGEEDVLFHTESFTRPGRYLCYRSGAGTTEPTSLVDGAAVNLEDVQVVRERATSKDGTKVPLTILLPAGYRAGKTYPCIVTGYGGYGISIPPRFRPLNKIYADHDIIYVIANIRGGGEFGEEWHLEGNLTNKQNVFDDFAAVLQHVLEQGYTSSEQLAIIGGSNGGLLMGATFTQHPDLMRAVVSKVGIYDMLRVELSPNGAFNIPEFGTVEDPEQFRALHAYSPYHAVKEGTQYPAILLTTGENDPRVDPMQSRKMAARLQAANASDSPILLRTNASTGHGADASLNERIEEEVDVLAFLFDQLGVNVK
ncbi:MAG: S9 family peptidase [Planctomycetaceae bacterium]|nr:S9 family peptidase [Planctomycetaceae bacterium]